MAYSTLVARLIYDPQAAIAGFRTSRPVFKSFLVASLATLAYQSVLSGFARDLVAIVRLGGFDRGAAAIIAEQFAYILPATIFPLLVVVFAYVPLCLLLLGGLDPSLGAGTALKRDFEPVVTTALSLWTATLVLWIAPASIFVDPYVDWIVLVWSLLPLVFFVGMMFAGLEGIAGAGFGRAILASSLAACVLLILPLAAQSLWVLTTPFAFVVALLVLRDAYRDWSRARAERSSETESLEPMIGLEGAYTQEDTTARYDGQDDIDCALDKEVEEILKGEEGRG